LVPVADENWFGCLADAYRTGAIARHELDGVTNDLHGLGAIFGPINRQVGGSLSNQAKRLSHYGEVREHRSGRAAIVKSDDRDVLWYAHAAADQRGGS
jgi:hypothetical protein